MSVSVSSWRHVNIALRQATCSWKCVHAHSTSTKFAVLLIGCTETHFTWRSANDESLSLWLYLHSSREYCTIAQCATTVSSGNFAAQSVVQVISRDFASFTSHFSAQSETTVEFIWPIPQTSTLLRCIVHTCWREKQLYFECGTFEFS